MSFLSFRTVVLSSSNLPVGLLETVQRIIREQLADVQAVHEQMRSDEQKVWELAFRQLVDEQGVSLILTVGGIGPNGFVPDATQAVCHKLFPGFGTIIRQANASPASLLWRNVAGLCNQTMIVNLPDSVEAIQAGLPLLFPGIPNAIRLAGG